MGTCRVIIECSCSPVPVVFAAYRAHTLFPFLRLASQSAIMGESVEIYTDGSCSGNPGVGGWGALLRYDSTEREISGAALLTTNNRMEMMAAISALQALKRSCRVELYTDSKYLRTGITQWLPAWKKNGWKTKGRQPVRNRELWETLEKAAERHQVQWHWVQGHAGHQDNERADQLARVAMLRMKKKHSPEEQGAATKRSG